MAIDGPAAFAAAFDVSRESLDKLVAYETLLRQWQKTINLVAPATLDQVWHRHFADSAQIARFVPEAAKSWIDVGSGAGLPGLVVAIMLQDRPDIRVTLIESDARKAAFLREVARQTALDVDILLNRVEKVATQLKLPKADVVSARALAPLPRLFELVAWAFDTGTVGVFPKGRDVARELDAAQASWVFDHDLVPSLTDVDGRVVLVRNLKAKTGEQRRDG